MNLPPPVMSLPNRAILKCVVLATRGLLMSLPDQQLVVKLNDQLDAWIRDFIRRHGIPKD